MNVSTKLNFHAPIFLSWKIKRTTMSHIVGYPRIGPKRELKFALESYWDGKSTAENLRSVAKNLRTSIWRQQKDAGVFWIPSNTFSYYDHVLDIIALVGAVPERYGWGGGTVDLDTYFSMARGNKTTPAMEMTKWFDTNYHFIVPELGPDSKFALSSSKVVDEYKEALELGIKTLPVLLGPITFLLLSKPTRSASKGFHPLSLLDSLLPVYKEVLAQLKAAGAHGIQFDEPALILDLDSNSLSTFKKAYDYLGADFGPGILVQTYFADIPVEAYKTIIDVDSIGALGVDLVRGPKTLDLIKEYGFPAKKKLLAGIVDGRNIWANDLAASLTLLEGLATSLGKDSVIVSTSCSLLHTAVDLVNEPRLDEEAKSWMAFAAQKVSEVVALANALKGNKDEGFFASNAAAQASRRNSPRVHDESVKKATFALKGSDQRRATPVVTRFEQQQKKLGLPVLPTTTIGSFPQTPELRRVRREFKSKKISEDEYIKAIQSEISKVVKLQESLGLDVLVHGEPEIG